MTRLQHNDSADQRLRLLVGLYALLALAAIGWAVLHLDLAAFRGDRVRQLAVIFLIGVGVAANVRVRIGGNWHRITWVDAAIVVALAVAPPAWVILWTAVAVAFVKLVTRTAPIKTVFGVAKDTLNAVAAAFVVYSLLTVSPAELFEKPLGSLGILILAHLALTVVDEILVIPVLALATRTPIRRRFVMHLDFRVIAIVIRLIVAVMTIGLLTIESRLLIAVPLIVLCLHLWSASRLRTKAERSAWQDLASATDALNEVDLSHVLTAAVRQAAQLFAADEAEVEIWLGDAARLVRGTTDAITYDGTAGDAPVDDMRISVVRLEGFGGGADIGVLRLRFRGEVDLSEREQYTLRTFASALCTSIRNATAYTELERIAGQNAHDAAHDALTELANRRKFLERGAELLAKPPPDGFIALLLIDLNHFKEVNDTLGHTAGDKVLIQVARRLERVTPERDLVARLGGDEFAIVMTGLPTPAVAVHRAEGAIAVLHETFEVDGMRISVEASGGVALVTSGIDVEELLRQADIAMYHAKRANRRVESYTEALDTADIGQLALGGDLPRAVAEHEFTVNFQPIVDLGTGEVVAAEALARWRHPDRGNLGPRRFLAAVERSGLLNAFAEEILGQALDAAADWHEAGFNLPVAVNVSPRSLLDPEFPATVAGRLAAHRVPAERLILELTENLTLSQLEVVDQVLGELRRSGVRLALDDFGTGFSSLSVLSRIPVHELKIDQSFVTAMESSTEAAAVVRSTVDLARNLDLIVVAEGVESEPQRLALWQVGCTAGQGHLFARPMSSEQFLNVLTRGTGGRAGTLAAPLHDQGAVIRMPANRRPGRPRAAQPNQSA